MSSPVRQAPAGKGLWQSDGTVFEKKRKSSKISLDMGRIFNYYVWACGGEDILCARDRDEPGDCSKEVTSGEYVR